MIRLDVMADVAKILGQKSLVMILAYAPTGLGHLRVTDALYHGLPQGLTPLLLGSQDKSIGIFHRVMSVHPLGRALMEWIQAGWPEDLFTFYYREFLRSRTDLLYRQMITILDQRIDVPKTVLVVSTHFGLGHELAHIKEKLVTQKGVRVVLVVVVTDDTPQHLWYTPGADLTFVPSFRTREKLLEYGKKSDLAPLNIKVVSYPVSPRLAEDLTSAQQTARREQFEARTSTTIHVAVPISGAAVGLSYAGALIDRLSRISPRFVFHVISKTSPHTQSFLAKMQLRQNICLYVSTHDREVVEKYEELYQREVIALEITKPSEQAFKCLLKPIQRGGVILLFAHPVGRQEYDNMDFLRRHNLTSQVSEQKYLWDKAKKSHIPRDLESARIWQDAENWRAVRIPDEPTQAASFIWWALQHGLFTEMLRCKVIPSRHDPHAQELGTDGVKQIWTEIAGYVAGLT